MKYIVKTRETEYYTREYIVEADSGDEAKESVLEGRLIPSYETFDYTDDFEIIDIEPYEANEKSQLV